MRKFDCTTQDNEVRYVCLKQQQQNNFGIIHKTRRWNLKKRKFLYKDKILNIENYSMEEDSYASYFMCTRIHKFTRRVTKQILGESKVCLLQAKESCCEVWRFRKQLKRDEHIINLIEDKNGKYLNCKLTK